MNHARPFRGLRAFVLALPLLAGAAQPAFLVLDSQTGAAIPAAQLARISPDTLRILAPGYRPAQPTLVVPEATGTTTLPTRVWLDPIQPHRHLDPVSIRNRSAPDRMLLHGFILDAGTGQPLPDAQVQVQPGNTHARADSEGYFELQIVPGITPGNARPISLVVTAAGHQSRLLEDVEAWPGGDWLFRFHLPPGSGLIPTRDADRRRHPEAPFNSIDPAAGVPFPPADPPPAGEQAPSRSGLALPSADPDLPIRLPRTIRVRTATGIDYVSLETYTKRVLPAEWIPSWGNLNQGRGMHSLRAGAVAVRTYAVGYVHAPYAADADICATTSCQVYNPERQSSLTDQAVDETAGNVLVDASGWVGFKLTEYSAENNGLGTTCGDGFVGNAGTCRADPVCGGLGLTRNGHGRGLCQTGSARWATGWYRVLSNPGSPHPYGTRTWQAILTHYYPTLSLRTATPLALHDGVELWNPGNSTVAVRACPNGSISAGTGCTVLTRVSNGERGYITDGPVQVVADGNGYTWWKVRWPALDAEGWTAENFLQRGRIPTPACPCELRLATPVLLSDDTCNLALTGSVGLPFTLEQSTNLRSWTLVATGRIPPSTRVTFAVDPDPSSHARYFRARW